MSETKVFVSRVGKHDQMVRNINNFLQDKSDAEVSFHNVSESRTEGDNSFEEAYIFAKCAICGKFMNQWDRDFDHKNGNSSNNKLSNCRALHPSCHRRMHALGGK